MMQKSSPHSEPIAESIAAIDKAAASDAISKNIGDSHNPRIVDILDSEYRGISLYAVSMLLLVIAILWTGISVVEQIQTYHKSYNQLSKLKRDFRALQIEHQRMMIEQQTFSGTPQVTNRAATELNMFYPDFSDRMIIHANGAVAKLPSDVRDESTTTTANSQTTDEQSIDSVTDNSISNTMASQTAPETQH